MKIISFKVCNLFGYINHNIKFNEDVSFLIGINGCGKTTVLRLIRALLNHYIKDLVTIEFDNIVLDVCCGEDVVNLVCDKTHNRFNFYYNKKTPQTLELPINIIDIEYDFIKGYIQSDDYDLRVQKIIDVQALSYIDSFNKSIFLGLDRKSDDVSNPVSLRCGKGRLLPIIHGDDESAIDRIQRKAVYLYSRDLSNQAELINQYRNDIVKLSLNFNFKFEKIEGGLKKENFQDKLEHLSDKKIEFETALSNLMVDGVKEISDSYFVEMERILKNIIESDSNSAEFVKAISEYILISSQRKKVNDIIEKGHQYKKKLDHNKEYFIRFKKAMEMFLAESGKIVIQTKNGEIRAVVKKNKKMIDINNLSSGEKQLLIMLGNLAFSGKEKPKIFVIDEPELSLHISWQEIFVEALRVVSPDTQLIFATHAPSLVSDENNMNKCIDLTCE